MAKQAPHPPSPAAHTPSPIRENWTAVVFMIALLLASGLTASIVGYRIKQADRDRKAQLFRAYEAIGGDRERLVNLEQTLLGTPLSHERETFLAVYEVNERSRAFGLYRWMEFSKPETIEKAVAALDEINAHDPARVVEASLTAIREGPPAPTATHPDQTPVNPKAARISKKYDRYVARDVETKLFIYLNAHRPQVLAQ